MIAKSNGLNLKEHSLIVNEYALELLYKIINHNSQERFLDVVKFSSMLHDIGKLTINFQDFLKGKRKTPGLKFRHNEIGWAFLSKYLSEDLMNIENREMLLNIVYWHHGISNQIQKHTDTEILESLDKKSLENMVEYLTDIVGDNYVIKEVDTLYSNKSPLFYVNDKILSKHSHSLNLLRSIVVTADRNSSDFQSLSDVDFKEEVDKYFRTSEKINITNSKFDGSKRYELQKSIVNQIQEGKTTLVKAPAGFGKTLLGLMWGLKTGEKQIWVVPRNAIAKSLYKSILEELDNLNITTSIQLILSGEIENSNCPDIKEYESNIIVTNIDNFLAPNFQNNIMDSSALLFGARVIFDEYHELVSDAPLMSLFVDIMRARNLLTSCSTLLLSATPINCYNLWELGKLNPERDTVILPNKEEHYPAAHTKKYLIKVHKQAVDILPNTNSLCIKNTVKSAQAEKRRGNYDMLLHSNFTKEQKDEMFNRLLNNYGKHSELNINKPNIIGTHILQASFDISFSALYENILSPESTMQRIGRICRWGELDNCVINIIKDYSDQANSKGENTIKNILYNRNLSDLWFDYIYNWNNKEITLDELYVIYNKFNIDNQESISKYISEEYRNSKDYLHRIYPIKIDIPVSKKDNKFLTAGSNKLRSVNNQIFYIVKHENGKDWVGHFSKQIIKDFGEEFKEDGNIYNRMIKTMKILRNNNDERFEYNDIIDADKYGGNIDKVRKMAKKSNTPYIVYDRYYSDELGIV
jgi:CRISPR-associated endonuclease Cas3-HD